MKAAVAQRGQTHPRLCLEHAFQLLGRKLPMRELEPLLGQALRHVMPGLRDTGRDSGSDAPFLWSFIVAPRS